MTASPLTGENSPFQLPHVTLASTSPRRQQLLRQIGVPFTVVPPVADETPYPGEDPETLVRRLALEKARSVASMIEGGVVLGSDTVVVLDGDILGKPADQAEAFAMLRRLSGRTHHVHTGYALIDVGAGRTVNDVVRTEVTFRPLEDEEIRSYIATGSPMDKAGSYGIQDDYGAVFIEKITGDYYTVVGLPLTTVYLALREMARGR
jgi:septum formation protein